MADVLYLDRYEDDCQELSDLLSSEGMFADCPDIAALGIDDKSPYEGLLAVFGPTLYKYKLLITHLGVNFNSHAPELLESYPKLHLILISDIEDYATIFKQEQERSTLPERLIICSYHDPNLIRYVRDCLGKH